MRGRTRKNEKNKWKCIICGVLISSCYTKLPSKCFSSSAFLSNQKNIFCCFRNYIYVTTDGFAINFQEKHKQIYAVFLRSINWYLFFCFHFFQFIFHLQFCFWAWKFAMKNLKKKSKLNEKMSDRKERRIDADRCLSIRLETQYLYVIEEYENKRLTK